MTTETKAKRTPGKITFEIHEQRAYLYGTDKSYIGEVDLEHAEYIRKAWNLHEELVAVLTRIQDEGDAHSNALATTLLAKAQP